MHCAANPPSKATPGDHLAVPKPHRAHISQPSSKCDTFAPEHITYLRTGRRFGCPTAQHRPTALGGCGVHRCLRDAAIFPPLSLWPPAEQRPSPFKGSSCSVPGSWRAPKKGSFHSLLHFLDRNCHFSNTASLLLARRLSPRSALTSGCLCDALCGVLCSRSFSAAVNARFCPGPGSQRGAAGGTARPPSVQSVPPPKRGHWLNGQH